MPCSLVNVANILDKGAVGTFWVKPEVDCLLALLHFLGSLFTLEYLGTRFLQNISELPPPTTFQSCWNHEYKNFQIKILN
jgi:hypothetical protein